MKRAAFPFLFYLASGLVVIFILLPLVSTILSTNLSDLSTTIKDREASTSLGLTFFAGLISTVIGVITGVPLAYLLARGRFHGRLVIESIIDLPVVVPHTAAGIALLMVFGRQGVLGQHFGQMGFYFTDNLAGIVVAMLFVSIPFLVNASQAAFELVDTEMEDVARVNGASSWQVFWFIALPQAWRGITGGAIMMWARGISEFGAVIILAYHPKILPVLVYERFSGFGLSSAQPLAVILIIVVLVVFLFLRWLWKTSATNKNPSIKILRKKDNQP